MERLGGTRRSGAGKPASDVPSGQRLATAPEAAPAGFADRVLLTLAGARQPIVAILLAIAFFTVISGKPLDGLLLVIVATALARDAGISAREAAARREAAQTAIPAAGQGSAHPEPAEPDPPSAWRLRTRRPRLRRLVLGTGAAVVYSLTVGSFTRYSWPATAGVVGLGAGVVVVGWGGPVRQRDSSRRLSRTGVLAWGSILVAGGLWELGALLGQPTFEQSSYAHPTISTLTNPLLHSSLGRSVALLGWVGLGAFLVER